jgi:hypothetical protein
MRRKTVKKAGVFFGSGSYTTRGENKALKQVRLFGRLFALFCIFTFVSCQFQPDYPASGKDIVRTTEREHLAVLKARDNHTLSEDVLKDVVAGFLNPEQPGRSLSPDEKTTITGTARLSVIGEKRFPAGFGARSAAGEENAETVEVYVFDTEKTGNGNPGYVLACNDIRVGAILGVAEEGSLNSEETAWFTEIVYQGIGNYIDRIIEEYESITEEEVSRAVARSAASATTTINGVVDGDPETETGSGTIEVPSSSYICVYGQYKHLSDTTRYVYYVSWDWYDGYYATIPVAWDQRYPYNYIVDQVRHNGTFQNKYVTGCWPTAIAQLMAFHKKPANYTFVQTNPNRPVYNCTDPVYHWTDMVSSLTKTSHSSSGAMDIAKLMYEIGERMVAEYTEATSSNSYVARTAAPTANVKPVLQAMGYTVNGDFINYTGNFSALKNSIIAGWPVPITGQSDPNTAGHAWLIDGVRRMAYNEYMYDNDENNWWYGSPGDEPGHGNPYTDWVHCNLGWGDSYGTSYGASYNAWYVSGIFNTREYHQALARSGISKYYDTNLKILPNVH